MPAVTPPYALGRHAKVFVTPMVPSVSGVWSVAPGGFTLPIQGRVESHTMTTELSTEGVSPMHIFGKNPIPMEIGAKFEISEDAMAGADLTTAATDPTRGNVLKVCSKLSVYAKVALSLVDDAGAELDRITILGVWTGLPSPASVKGRITWTGTLETKAVLDSATGSELANPFFGVPVPF